MSCNTNQSAASISRLVIFLSLSSLIFLGTLKPGFGQDYIRPIKNISDEKIRIVEGISYCHGGYGYQKTAYKIGGKYFVKDTGVSPYLPTIKPLYITYLGFGCVFNKWFINYYLIDDSMKFSSLVQFQDKTYNSIQIHLNSLATGYVFSLIPHYLYFDLGLSYLQFNYKFGLFGVDGFEDLESDTMIDQDYFYHGAIKWYISPFIYFHWQNQTALNQESLISTTNQIGINLFSRF